MTLEIIWRNPTSPRVTKQRIEQVVADAYGAVYEVRSGNETKEFELILRGAA